MRHGPYRPPEVVCPVAVAALHRHPEYADIFPIGVSLAAWATWSA